MSSSKKEHLNMLVMGHVDNGKSTLVGHLLFLAGGLDDRTLAALEEEAKQTGKEFAKFAWLGDKLKEERERDMTIDLSFWKFETPKYFFTIIDAPGHRDFVKNMITGASQADAAILVISSKKGEYEAGMGPGGQTREHAFLAKTLGVNQIVVAVNKMDDQTVNYDEKRFNEVKDGVLKFLKMIGYDISKIIAVPISGWKGDNIIKQSKNTAWYKGPTLFEAMDTFIPPEKPINKPLRVPVQDVYTITGVGTVPVGRVETGVMKKNMNVIFVPANKGSELKDRDPPHEDRSGTPGDNVGATSGRSKTDVRRETSAETLSSHQRSLIPSREGSSSSTTRRQSLQATPQCCTSTPRQSRRPSWIWRRRSTPRPVQSSRRSQASLSRETAQS